MAVTLRLEAITIDGMIRKTLIDHKGWTKAPLNVVQKFNSDTLGPVEIEGRGVKGLEGLINQGHLMRAMRMLRDDPELDEVRMPVAADNTFWAMRR